MKMVMPTFNFFVPIPAEIESKQATELNTASHSLLKTIATALHPKWEYTTEFEPTTISFLALCHRPISFMLIDITLVPTSLAASLPLWVSGCTKWAFLASSLEIVLGDHLKVCHLVAEQQHLLILAKIIFETCQSVILPSLTSLKCFLTKLILASNDARQCSQGYFSSNFNSSLQWQ